MKYLDGIDFSLYTKYTNKKKETVNNFSSLAHGVDLKFITDHNKNLVEKLMLNDAIIKYKAK